MGVQFGTPLNMGEELLQGPTIEMCWNAMAGHISYKTHYINQKLREIEHLP